MALELRGIARFIALAPWVGLAVGLFFLLIGERMLGDTEGPRTVFTGLALLLIIGAFAVRLYGFIRGSALTRKGERPMLFCYVGVILAVAGYFLTTETGLSLLDITDVAAAAKFTTAATVLWLIVLAVSLIPLMMVEISVGVGSWSRFPRLI